MWGGAQRIILRAVMRCVKYDTHEWCSAALSVMRLFIYAFYETEEEQFNDEKAFLLKQIQAIQPE